VPISDPTCKESQVLSKPLGLEVEEPLSKSAAAADSFHIGFQKCVQISTNCQYY
jgi:hypothetical protein